MLSSLLFFFPKENRVTVSDATLTLPKVQSTVGITSGDTHSRVHGGDCAQPHRSCRSPVLPVPPAPADCRLLMELPCSSWAACRRTLLAFPCRRTWPSSARDRVLVHEALGSRGTVSRSRRPATKSFWAQSFLKQYFLGRYLPSASALRTCAIL